ncbi:hypothetical protein [Bifidobacterium apicola]
MNEYEYEPKTEQERRQMEEMNAKAERGERLDVIPGSVRTTQGSEPRSG